MPMQSSPPQQYLQRQPPSDPTVSPKPTTSIAVAIAHDAPLASPSSATYTGLTDANAPLAANSYSETHNFESIRVNRILYSSAYLALFQAAQFGWSLSQLNLSTFHDADACSARPVVDGTCVMFPGHSSSQWTWAVNAWVLGGMAGSLGCGRLSDHYGRKPTFLGNCVVMALGALVQASASSVTVFALGRAIAGVASGVATAMTNGYISEIAPPHLRNTLGVGYQIAIALGILIVCATFFVADTSTGWRYIAGFPAVMALVFAGVAPRLMVESPTWLLARGRQQDAEREIAKLFGENNVALALAWMQQPLPPPPPPAAPQPLAPHADDTKSQELLTHTHTSSSSQAMNPWRAMFSSTYRRQTLLAVCLALALQFSGINAVFLYSSSMFTDAGVADGRVGSLIVNIVNLLPSFGAGYLATRFGNRTMILCGQLIMLVSAVGLTIALVTDISVLSIAFTALHVAGFSVSLGPLAFIVAAEVFPEELRASGGSLTLFTNWSGTLLIGVGFPYVADALQDLGFVPFIITLVLFTAFMVKFLPETSGKTSDEIQELYRHTTQ